ncbi:hypothetical protein ABZZ79_02885 [Streptomyces sp. NPDC006458]|uniref:hypothetical protein n=1 Tax=Streptomyces sp. NPDC006458 TaxID=3154302 RepID=UPI0033A3ACE3
MILPTVWLASPDGLVSLDLIAIERAMNGQRHGWTLASEEAWYAARVMLDAKVPYSKIVSRVGLSVSTLREWFPGEIAPASPHLARPGNRKCGHRRGTRRGYRWHAARMEPPCDFCMAGMRAADRHYRQHGTYIGAPQITRVPR